MNTLHSDDSSFIIGTIFERYLRLIFLYLLGSPKTGHIILWDKKNFFFRLWYF